MVLDCPPKKTAPPSRAGGSRKPPFFLLPQEFFPKLPLADIQEIAHGGIGTSSIKLTKSLKLSSAYPSPEARHAKTLILSLPVWHAHKVGKLTRRLPNFKKGGA